MEKKEPLLVAIIQSPLPKNSNYGFIAKVSLRLKLSPMKSSAFQTSAFENLLISVKKVTINGFYGNLMSVKVKMT